MSEFAHQVTSATGPPDLPEHDPAAIGLYIPAHHYIEDTSNPGNVPSTTIADGTVAMHMLSRRDRTSSGGGGAKQRRFRGVFGGAKNGLPAPRSALRTLVVSGAQLTGPELASLEAWVRGGGRLLIAGVSDQLFRSNASAASALLGAISKGTIKAGRLHMDNFGAAGGGGGGRRNWTMQTAWRTPAKWPPLPAHWPTPLAAALVNRTEDGAGFERVWTSTTTTTATTTTTTATSPADAAAAETKVVVALRNRLGAGTVFACVAPVASSIDITQAANVRDTWAIWYEQALACLENSDMCDKDSKNIKNEIKNKGKSESKNKNKKHLMADLSGASSLRLGHSGNGGRSGGGSAAKELVPLHQSYQHQYQHTRERKLLTVGVYLAQNTREVTSACDALNALGHTTRVLASPVNASTLVGFDALLLPSQEHVTLPDQRLLADRVAGGGGCLIWHGYSPRAFSSYGNNLIGAAAADFRVGSAEFQAFNHTWINGAFKSSWPVFGEVTTIDPEVPAWGTAKVLASDSRGTPALFRNKWGHGLTIMATSAMEQYHSVAQLQVLYLNELAMCTAT